jgi:hypothetical protein
VRIIVDIPSVPTIPTSDIPSISPIDPTVDNTYDLPDVSGSRSSRLHLKHRAKRDGDSGQRPRLSRPGNRGPSSADFGNFPVQITATLPLDWTTWWWRA